MSDRLSLPNLISQLQVTHNDETLISLCHEVERLRRRRYYQKAVEVAQQAVEVALPLHMHNAIGIALLYLALARLDSQVPDGIKHAIQDCEQAAVHFKLEPHNYAFARVFRAEVDQQQNRPAQSVIHLQEAADTFLDLNKNSLAHGELDRAREYRDWYSALQAVIVERSEKLAEIDRVPASKKQKRERVFKYEQKPLIGWQIPLELLWPIPEPLTIAEMLPTKPNPDSQSPHDLIVVDKLTIKGEIYAVQPIGYKAQLKAHLDQPYIVMQIKSTDHSNHLILVRKGKQPAHAGQTVAAIHPKRERVWLEGLPVVKIIGGVKTRQWVYFNLPDDELNEVQVLGIVEAVLIPMTSVITISQLKELVDRLNELQSAENHATGTFARGLNQIRSNLEGYFAKYYGLQRIPIVPTVTMFDPKQGHIGIQLENRPNLPKGVILRVVWDGYIYYGNIVREARVIVNK